jgi:hypothetical protein
LLGSFLGWERTELKLRRTLREGEVLQPWWNLEDSLMLEGSKRERGASFYTYRKNENPERETACCWTLEWTKFSQKEKFYIFYLRQDIREYLRELRK